MLLPPGDLRLLKRILETGHRLERIWPLTGAPDSGECLELAATLKDLISQCQGAGSSDLKRLSMHERNISSAMSARHLSAILVPFERLLGRALRDDEFLVSTEDRKEFKTSKGPLVVVAENIRSAFNVGAILRTAECFGADRVILAGYTSNPDEDKTLRTSMGAEKYVSWESTAQSSEAVDKLKEQGYTLVALETVEGASELGAFQWPGKPALLLGNERFGLDRETLSQADCLLKIPLYGQKNSLNVGIAFGIAISDWRRQHEARNNGTIERSESSAAQKDASDTMEPIGVFRASSVHPYEARRQGSLNTSESIGYIELKENRQFEQSLEDLEGFDRLWLLYKFHHNPNWKPKVLPPRGPRIKRGVFSTRSPYRPNAIGLSCVELVRVSGLKVYVKGFDLLDETPIYDIKPYLPYADAFPESRTGWLEDVPLLKYRIEFSPECQKQLDWLARNGVKNLREFLLSQLEFEPLDSKRKRVRPLNTGSAPETYCLAYRTWRVAFEIETSAHQIEVLRIESGYSESDLATPEDLYGDKSIHKAFLDRFNLAK